MNGRRTTTWALRLLSLAVLVGISTGGNALNVQAKAASLSSNGALDHSANFPVEFTDCVESIGVTLVPTASARAYVPNQFILAGDGQPVTPLVVRTARCVGIAVDGHRARPGELSARRASVTKRCPQTPGRKPHTPRGRRGMNVSATASRRIECTTSFATATTEAGRPTRAHPRAGAEHGRARAPRRAPPRSGSSSCAANHAAAPRAASHAAPAASGRW